MFNVVIVVLINSNDDQCAHQLASTALGILLHTTMQWHHHSTQTNIIGCTIPYAVLSTHTLLHYHPTGLGCARHHPMVVLVVVVVVELVDVLFTIHQSSHSHKHKVDSSSTNIIIIIIIITVAWALCLWLGWCWGLVVLVEDAVRCVVVGCYVWDGTSQP